MKTVCPEDFAVFSAFCILQAQQTGMVMNKEFLDVMIKAEEKFLPNYEITDETMFNYAFEQIKKIVNS